MDNHLILGDNYGEVCGQEMLYALIGLSNDGLSFNAANFTLIDPNDISHPGCLSFKKSPVDCLCQ